MKQSYILPAIHEIMGIKNVKYKTTRWSMVGNAYISADYFTLEEVNELKDSIVQILNIAPEAITHINPLMKMMIDNKDKKVIEAIRKIFNLNPIKADDLVVKAVFMDEVNQYLANKPTGSYMLRVCPETSKIVFSEVISGIVTHETHGDYDESNDNALNEAILAINAERGYQSPKSLAALSLDYIHQHNTLFKQETNKRKLPEELYEKVENKKQKLPEENTQQRQNKNWSCPII